jgi:hypothetical protein
MSEDEDYAAVPQTATTEDIKKFLDETERLKQEFRAEEPEDRFDAHRYAVTHLMQASNQLAILLKGLTNPEANAPLEFLKELHKLSVQARCAIMDINSAIARNNLASGIYPHRRKAPAGIA